jgi:hypothetical protein
LAKERIVTNDVQQRVSRADIELSKWMKEQGIFEIDTESCMGLLVEKKIYDYDWNHRGHYFREDLRTLRDNGRLDVFSHIAIEQKEPGSKWIIYLKI